jgi:DNA primase
MARIAEAEIERLKKEVSLERLAEARGVKLKRHGEDLVGLCPFHDDREPSLVITPKTNLWHCLGACQAGGSPIDWVMKERGIRFRHAAELLLKDFSSLVGAQAPRGGPPPTHNRALQMPALAPRDVTDDALMLRVVSFYHATLTVSVKIVVA